MSISAGIPFLDLVTPHLELEDELMAVFQKALRTAGFIGGRAVESFEHDFAAFCRRPPGRREGPIVRAVRDARWADCGDGVLRFEIEAGSFCHQMVRSVVGLLVEVGVGRRKAGELTGVLAARNRSAAGPIAPPHGLCLWEVKYAPEQPGSSEPVRPGAGFA